MNVVLAKQPRAAAQRFAVGAFEREAAALRADLDVRGQHVGLAVGVEADAILLALALGKEAIHIAAVRGEEGDAVLGQGLDELILGAGDVLDGAERLQMLGADAGEQAVFGMHQLAKFLDVAHVPGAHLGDEDLMLALELLVDHARKAHGRVEAGGRSQHAVFLREYIAQDKFGGGLAVAAGDADLDQIRAILQLFARALEELAVDALLQGLGDGRRAHDDIAVAGIEQVRRQGDERQKRRTRQAQQHDKAVEPAHTAGEHQRLFRRRAQIEHGQRRRDRHEQRQHHPVGHALAAHALGDEQREEHRQVPAQDRSDQTYQHAVFQKPVAVAAHPAAIAGELIALQLQHVDEVPAGDRAADGHQHDADQRKWHKLHIAPIQ